MGTFLAAGAVGGARRPLAEVQQPKGGGKAGGGGKAALPLSMYGELPEGEIAIEEFERFALDRLRGEAAQPGCGSRARRTIASERANAWVAPPAARCQPACNAASCRASAVLKGIDDLKVKGFRPDQMQASAACCCTKWAGRACCSPPPPLLLLHASSRCQPSPPAIAGEGHGAVGTAHGGCQQGGARPQGRGLPLCAAPGLLPHR